MIMISIYCNLYIIYKHFDITRFYLIGHYVRLNSRFISITACSKTFQMLS